MPEKLPTPEALSPNLQEMDACLTEVSRKITLGNASGLELVSEAFDALGVPFARQERNISVESKGSQSDEDATLVHFALRSMQQDNHSSQKRLQNLLPAGIGVCLATLISRHGEAGCVRIVFDEPATPSQTARESELASTLKNATRLLGVCCDPEIPAGRVAVKFGVIYPRFDRLVVELFKDLSSTVHSDLVEVAGHVVTSLTQITVRKTNPLTPARIAFDALDLNQAAGGNTSKLILTGTIGTMTESVTDEINEILQRTLQALAASYGVGYNCTIEAYQPALHCHFDLTTKLRQTAVAVLGKDSAIEVEYSTGDLTGLAAYLEKIPGTVLFIGSHFPPSEVSIETRLAETLQNSVGVLYGFLRDLRVSEV